MDIYGYLGPYVAFKKEMITVVEEQNGCAKCKIAGSSAYCPICGSTWNKFKKKTKQPKVEPCEIIEQLSQDLWAPGEEVDKNFDIYLPDGKVKGIKRELTVIGEKAIEQAYDIGNLDIIGETVLFTAKFEKSLDILAKAYDQKPTVRWGFVSYYS